MYSVSNWFSQIQSQMSKTCQTSYNVSKHFKIFIVVYYNITQSSLLLVVKISIIDSVGRLIDISINLDIFH